MVAVPGSAELKPSMEAQGSCECLGSSQARALSSSGLQALQKLL